MPAPKRPLKKDFCKYCDSTTPVVFDKPLHYQRHLMSAHNHDYCKKCRLIGPVATIRFHIIDEHPNELCLICCGTSPIFGNRKQLVNHMCKTHDRKSADGPSGDGDVEFACLDCDQSAAKVSFTSQALYRSHLLEVHLTKGDTLQIMKRPRLTYEETSGQSSSSAPGEDLYDIDTVFDLKPICKVVGGPTDCFSISSLHLLAQTGLADLMREPLEGHTECPQACCILASFFSLYKTAKSTTAQRISQNYASFGIESLPLDCATFLRLMLDTVGRSRPDDHLSLDAPAIRALFEVSLQWKYECSECKRFCVVNLRDCVLTLDGSRESTFGDLLEKFVRLKACPSCGYVCPVFVVGEFNLHHSGEFLLFEIDRTISGDDNTKEIVLYPLQLEQVSRIQ